ncbi:MAG: FAD:protein FMN transferase [Oscillospiraceae bacterium]|nr:FAD:protein FMN transferase [Oscillospiraceae bacterium]
MKYRVFLPVLLMCLLCGCSADTAVSSQSPEANDSPAVSDLFAMDTYMNLKVWCSDGETVLKDGARLIQNLEQTLSVTNPESDTSRINQNAGSPVEISEDTSALIQEALQIGDASHGALDVTIYPVLKAWGFTTQEYQIPDEKTIQNLLSHVDYTQIQLDGNRVTIPEGAEIDFGSLAKGYTSDRLMQLFKENGAESAIVNLGGNVQTLGTKPDGSQWSVAVVNPLSPAENLCILKIENQAVITSGNYERYFEGDDGNIYWHIIDPKDGYPADNGLISVTIIGESGLLCDALSTALFAEGTEQAIQHYQTSDDFEMILVTDDGRILLSEGIQEQFQNISTLPVEVIPHE